MWYRRKYNYYRTPVRQKILIMRDDFLVFGSPAIEEEEIAEVVDSLRSGWIGTGPKVGIFEQNFRDYVNAEYAIAVSSCTAALHLSMVVADIGPGDEVITTPMTFCATANAIVNAGAQPVFVDIDLKTMNLDPNLVEQAISNKTKAILPVHFAGRPCEMHALSKIAEAHELYLIEDAAHAIESRSDKGKIGAIADLSCFSFYVTKNVVTAEGGMITTNRKDWADRLKIYALHGMSRDAWKRYSDSGFKHYEVLVPGFKYNMTDIQASIGIHQLNRVEKCLSRRTEIWNRYDDAFRELPVITPAETPTNLVHARHLYTILIDSDFVGCDRDTFQERMQKQNIGTGIHYTSLHLQPYYKDTYNYKVGDFPNTEYISKRTLSLPLGPKMKDKDVSDVINAVKQSCH